MNRFAVIGVLTIGGLLAGQSALAESGSGAEPSHFWAGASVKYWMANVTPAGNFPAAKSSMPLLNLAFGWDRVFFNITANGGNQVISNAAYPSGQLTTDEFSFGLGYNVNENVGIVLGRKNIATRISAPASLGMMRYTTVAALLNFPVPDSKVNVFGSVAVGRGQSDFASANSGNISGRYTGYELGVNYPIVHSLKASISYKAESFAMYYSDTVANANTQIFFPGTETRKGFAVGLSYMF